MYKFISFIIVFIYVYAIVLGIPAGVFSCGFYASSNVFGCLMGSLIPGLVSIPLLIILILKRNKDSFHKINIILFILYAAIFGGRYFIDNILPMEQKMKYVYGFKELANCQNNTPAYFFSYEFDQNQCYIYFAKKGGNEDICTMITSHPNTRVDCLHQVKERSILELTPEYCEKFAINPGKTVEDADWQSNKNSCLLNIEYATKLNEVKSVKEGSLKSEDVLKRCDDIPYTNKDDSLRKFHCYLGYVESLNRSISITNSNCTDSHEVGLVRDICHIDQALFASINIRRMDPVDACKLVKDEILQMYCNAGLIHY